MTNQEKVAATITMVVLGVSFFESWMIAPFMVLFDEVLMWSVADFCLWCGCASPGSGTGTLRPFVWLRLLCCLLVLSLCGVGRWDWYGCCCCCTHDKARVFCFLFLSLCFEDALVRVFACPLVVFFSSPSASWRKERRPRAKCFGSAARHKYRGYE